MNYYKKMVMITLDDYNKYRNQMYALQTNPPVNPMQKELDELKDQFGDSLLPDQKTKLEGEIISKYTSKNIENNENEIPSVSETNKVDEDTSWLKLSIDDFNKTNRARAKQMYSILEGTLGTMWNSKGELKLSNGSTIPGSNILDLINFVTTPSKTTQNVPIGLDHFVILLKEANVPQFLFSRKGVNALQSVDDDEEIIHEHKQITPKQMRKQKRRQLKVIDDDEESDIKKSWIQ